jgi:hypothetical protein
MMTKIFGFLLSLAIMFGIISSIVHFINKQDIADKRDILSDPGFVKGIVLEKRSYKGKGMTIKYKVQDQEYRLSTGVKDSVFKHFNVGDSIPLLYWVQKPNTAMVKFSNELK